MVRHGSCPGEDDRWYRKAQDKVRRTEQTVRPKRACRNDTAMRECEPREYDNGHTCAYDCH